METADAWCHVDPRELERLVEAVSSLSTASAPSELLSNAGFDA